MFDQVLRKLTSKKYNIDYLYSKDYFVFKIENFFDSDAYNFISKNFPPVNKSQLINKFNKFSFNSDTEYYNELMKNYAFMDIHNFFTSKVFNDFIINKLIINLFKSRVSDWKYFFRLFKPTSLNNYSNPILFNNLYSKIQYSYISDEGKINPHTDSTKKLISLMFYFPDDQVLSLEQQKNFGTKFYINDMQNYKNEHLEDNYLIEQFYNSSKLACETKFERYHLYGFIRNSKSWHTVEKISAPKNYFRKSINYNIFFK